jgi:hypothetical protein
MRPFLSTAPGAAQPAAGENGSDGTVVQAFDGRDIRRVRERLLKRQPVPHAHPIDFALFT